MANGPTHFIYKYANRKLYSKALSQTCNIRDIELWVRHGENIVVIDNKTQTDITDRIFLQIAFNKITRTSSPSELASVIRQYGTVGNMILKLRVV